MKIFVLASYSSKVDYGTGEVFAEYKAWLEDILSSIESYGYEVFCALRADGYKINDTDPAAAYKLDMESLQACDAVFALVSDIPSAGGQTEIGVGVALGRRVVLAHLPEDELAYFNGAMVKAGIAHELLLPLDRQKLNAVLGALG
jgi:nucleoside 2-deoxyribosyltransferase